MKKHAENVIELTRILVERFGPRPAGSPESRGCADALAETAGPHSDSVKTEDFTLSPLAFLGWIRLLVASYVIALAGMWLGWYAASSLLLIAAVVLLVLQFFMYREVIDPIYPKAEGRNVLASIEPEGEVLGELMISGHHDSARIFNFLVHQPGLFALRVNGGIGSIIALTVMNIILTILSFSGVELSWVRIPAIIFTILLVIIVQLWFFASSKYTPGAGDNLASSAVAWEYLKICADAKKAGTGFKHLRVTAVSWDAEEAGLRGSRAWRKTQSTEVTQYPRWNLNLECLYDVKELFLMSSDINGSVELSKPLADKCSIILSKSVGYKVPVKPIAFLTGGTDAGETARAGVEATSLMGMPWENDAHSSVYHTPKDTVENVSIEAVEAALSLADTLAKELDAEVSCV